VSNVKLRAAENDAHIGMVTTVAEGRARGRAARKALARSRAPAHPMRRVGTNRTFTSVVAAPTERAFGRF